METSNFLEARNLGLTGTNLLKVLLEKNSIEEVRKTGIAGISEAFSKHRLLIWNYFPFLRGGSHCEGMNGLPDATKYEWIRYCDEQLGKFLKCVNADRVLFATNQGVKEAREACVKKCETSTFDVRRYHSLPHPRSWFGSQRMEKIEPDLRAAFEE